MKLVIKLTLQIDNNYSMAYGSDNIRRVYPEDITCVVSPRDGKGGIFIGNL